MTQLEFIKISEKEVEQLNGGTSEVPREAWRAGFNYARKIVLKSMTEDYQDEFLNKIEDFANKEMEIFKFNVSPFEGKK